MPLPKDFQFSQSSLQDFVECRRRFYLRYILKLRWPAVKTEPVVQSERLMLQGSAFHHYIHQYLLGVSTQQILTIMSTEEGIGSWWQNFLTHAQNLPGVGGKTILRFPEHTLAGVLMESRLVAKYDLISIMEDGNVIIYDWKTSQKKPKRSWLTARIQTVLYPYLLVIAGQHLAQPAGFQPHQVNLVYWFAAQPEKAETFSLDQAEFEKAQQQITDLTSLITRLASDNNEQVFPLTDDENRCAFCVYRSLCDRGVHAGNAITEMESETMMGEIEFAFDQIGEIEF